MSTENIFDQVREGDVVTITAKFGEFIDKQSKAIVVLKDVEPTCMTILKQNLKNGDRVICRTPQAENGKLTDMTGFMNRIGTVYNNNYDKIDGVSVFRVVYDVESENFCVSTCVANVLETCLNRPTKQDVEAEKEFYSRKTIVEKTNVNMDATAFDDYCQKMSFNELTEKFVITFCRNRTRWISFSWNCRRSILQKP